MQTNYRSEIDGLRALAVLPVIFFHAGFELFGGGYVGVDIFFVISGYLITIIILKELHNNTFSIKNFYERRARRILPALIFVILITSILSFIFLTQSELASYFKSVKSTLLFFSNFYFWKTTPYFVSESDLEPLLHTWSLSIEEQFYIFFPAVLLIFYKFLKKYILFFFIACFLLSIFICQVLAVKTGGTLNFYFTLSRAWELALGSMCAYILFKKKVSISNSLENLFSLIGFFFIIFSIFFFNKQTIYPSLYTLLPTIGTSLIILFANENSIIKKFLSIKLLVGFGLISYSLYLWHQPLLVFGRIIFDDFSNSLKISILFISFLFSILSYNFVEKIFRNKKKLNLETFLKTSLISIIFLIFFSQININFFSEKNSSAISTAKTLVNNEAVYLTKMDGRKLVKSRIIYETLKPKIIVIGSSRIRQAGSGSFKETILNLGVSGASIEDHITIAEMAIEKFNPDKIILGADPWLFNKNNNQFRWQSLNKEYQIALKNLNSNSKDFKILENIEKNKKIYFFEKILENIYRSLNIRRLNLDFEKGGYKENYKNINILLRDGQLVYAKQEIKEKLNPTIVKYSMDNYEFSQALYDNYKKFIDYVTNVHKKEVILVLSPYHLPSYELTIKSIPDYIVSEKKFKKLSSETKIQLVGSYNPTRTLCSLNEFYDFMHPKESCITKITNKIR